MDIFVSILLFNVLPLIMMISIGITLQKAFSLDIKTLSKLNFYVFSPAIIFKSLYTTEISLQLIGQVLLFMALFMGAQYIVLEIVIRLRRYQGGMKAAMRNSVLFYNSANYGIPLNQLAFNGNAYTLSIQVLIMMLQSLLPNTYGIYSVNAHKAKLRDIMKTIVTMPIIYAIPLAFGLRTFDVVIPEVLQIPLDYLASAFIGTALITLGVQLGSMSWRIKGSLAGDIALSVFLRLAAGPVLAWLIVLALDLPDLMAAALVVSAAVPTSLSSVLLAVEFDNEKEFASQTVFLSTLISIITVTVVIFLVL